MNIRLATCADSALAKTYPVAEEDAGSIAAGAGVAATRLEAIRLGAIWPETSLGNRCATIWAGESSEVRTGSALKPASTPAADPTPKTAKHAKARLLAR